MRATTATTATTATHIAPAAPAIRVVVAALRLAAAALVVVAIVVQLQRSLEVWSAQGAPDIPTKLVNFFSFFTIQSNVIAAVALAIGGVLLLRSGASDPRWFAVLRVCATTYIATTGVVFNLLLRGFELPQGATVIWTSEVMHVVIPILVVLDWLFAPGRRRLGFGVIGTVVIYPVVWAVYTMVRGPFVTDAVTGATSWYPYPFLNPDTSPNGYLSVAFYVVLIAVLIGAVGAGAIAVSRTGRAGRAAASDAASAG